MSDQNIGKLAGQSQLEGVIHDRIFVRGLVLPVAIGVYDEAQGVTQVEAAKLLGTTQAQVSALMRCRPVSVSVGRLMEFLTVLGQDVKVTVKPAPGRRKAGAMSVVVQDGPHVA